ncbi:MAG: SGNH/GDSL hydrolase family protein [Anaerolineae bacterium]|nr:SGNH/GDSL hydrolase family protein [Anaerolineae bacterium]
MRQRALLFVVTLALVLGTSARALPVTAQDGPDAYTSYQINMRTGPGVNFDVVHVLPPSTGVIFEARNADMSWLLGHTEDGSARGWVSSLYMEYRLGFSAVHLPVSDEVLGAPAAPAPEVQSESQDAPAPENAAAPDPAVPANPSGDASVALAASALASMPVVPAIGSRVQQIFAYGQTLGNNPRVFIEVGECNTLAQTYLTPFGQGAYNLGAYGQLQAAIDFFSVPPVGGVANSFLHKGAAMSTGMTCQAVIDVAMSNPQLCPAGTSPLECEIQRTRPGVMLVMLGLYDVYWLTPALYEQGMRRILDTAINNGVIPVLATFPTCGGDVSEWPNARATREANREAFNLIVVRLAQEYGVPVMNLWRATQSLPGCGLKVNGDFQHLSESGDRSRWASFNGDEYQWGFTMWNLVTLQTLDQLRINVLAQ